MQHDDVLCIDSSFKMPVMTLPTKTVLVRLQQGVVVISPSEGLSDVKDRVDDFGEVTDIVAPNLFHSASIPEARELFPRAVLWGVPGFIKKRPKIAWQQTIAPEDWPYGEELQLYPIAGMPRFNEVAMLHKPSKTLICTDLCFNYTRGSGLGYGIMFRMFGTYRRFAVSRLFMTMVRDKPAMAESVGRLIEADFDNIIMAHGENVYGGGKQRLIAALRERGIESD